ncbi:MAG: dephospho-CoA kinase [Peptococcaceae bacterium]
MIIGITGGIASGKTIVSDYVKKLGYPVVDADLLSREIMAPGSPVLEQVRHIFGETMIAGDGALNRKALAEKIFHDEQARQTLDGLTHPAIRALAEERFSQLEGESTVFFVVPLLFESGMDDLCDEIWLVHAEESLRRSRLSARDGIDETYAQSKIDSQMRDEERLNKGTRVLFNDGDLNHLYEQIESFLKKS